MRKRTAFRLAAAVVLTAGLVVFLSSCTVLRCVFMKHRSAHPRADHVDAECAGWIEDVPVEGMKVYVKGDPADPPILLLHELPGMMPETVSFADSLVQRHYRVYMPLFFGQPGHGIGPARQMAVCLGPNFNCLSSEESRVVGKLRILRHRIAVTHGGRKLGIIGMCLTGAMPLALADAEAAAIILSQPSVPFPLMEGMRRSLGVSQASLDKAKVSGVAVLRIRFAQDCLVPPERFKTIAAAIPADRLETNVVDSCNPKQHSVLTVESHDPKAQAAIAHAYDFLERNLRRNR